MKVYDVAVVGLGAMGSAAAGQLALRGESVIGFDAHRPPHSLGSSHGDTRAIREAYYEHPSYVPFVRRAYELWDELSEAGGKQLLRQTGALMVGREDGLLVPGARASAEQHGIPHESLSPKQMRARFPMLTPPDDVSGLLEHRAGIIDIEDALTAQLKLAGKRGAELHFDEPVATWRPVDANDTESPIRIETTEGTYQAERLVLTAGAWTGGFLRKLGLPLHVSRQVMGWFQPTASAEAYLAGAMPLWMWERGRQDFAYGFPDFGRGVKVGHHLPGDAVDPSGYDREVHDSDEAHLRGWLADVMPGAAGQMLKAETCMYVNTPDAHFLIDLHPKRPNIAVVSACSGHGFKFAPAIGEAVAELSTDRQSRHDLSMFGFARLIGERAAATA